MFPHFFSKDRRFRKRAGQALHEICVKKGTAYEPYVLEVQPSRWIFFEQAELQWRISLICPCRVEITTTWRCRRKMARCHDSWHPKKTEFDWNDGMTLDSPFLVSLPGQLWLNLFLFAGGRYILCEARAKLAWLTLATTQKAWKLLISGLACAIIAPWCRYPQMPYMPAVEFARSVWIRDLQRNWNARLPGPSCNIWSKRPSRRNCSSRHIKRPKSLTSSANATRKRPNHYEFWMIQLTLSKYTGQD